MKETRPEDGRRPPVADAGLVGARGTWTTPLLRLLGLGDHRVGLAAVARRAASPLPGSGGPGRGHGGMTLPKSWPAVVVVVVTVTATVALAVTADTGGRSSTASAGVHAAAERIRAIETDRLRALVAADMAPLRRVHAADFQLVDPTGETQSRDVFLGLVEAGDIDYLVFEPVSPIEVRISGSVAAIRYRSSIDIVVTGFGQHTHEAWHTDVYQRRHGRWQSTWSQATAIGL